MMMRSITTPLLVMANWPWSTPLTTTSRYAEVLPGRTTIVSLPLLPSAHASPTSTASRLGPSGSRGQEGGGAGAGERRQLALARLQQLRQHLLGVVAGFPLRLRHGRRPPPPCGPGGVVGGGLPLAPPAWRRRLASAAPGF